MQYVVWCVAGASVVKDLCLTALSVYRPGGYDMLMSPNQDERAVNDCHCPGDAHA